MPHIYIKGSKSQIPGDFTAGALVGTETIDATVAAGEIAIVIEDTFRMDSIEVDTLIQELTNVLRERGYSVL